MKSKRYKLVFFFCAAIFGLINISCDDGKSITGYVQSDSCKIYFESIGSGSPIIILHGNGFDHTCFRPHLDTLSKDHRLILIDLRGSGKSIDSSTISLQQMITDIDRVRDFFNLDSMVLMGHSMGGLIAMKYAAVFPDRVDALILVAPNPAQGGADTSSSIRVTKSKSKSKGKGVQYDSSLASYNLLPELSRLNTKTLLISAEHDAIPDSAHVQIASTMKNCKHIRIKNSGHFVFVDQPTEFCRTVSEFLDNK